MAGSTFNFNKQEFSERLIQIIEANLTNESFGVTQLAREMRMSRSSLHRRIKNATGLSVSQFICQVRLKKAQELLKKNTTTISEVAYECGFHSVTYFNKCFRDSYGYSPGEVKKQEKKTGTSNLTLPTIKHKKWLIASVLLSVLLIILLFTHEMFNFHVSPENSKLEKSIAVLPFRNDSPDSTNAYFINGLMESILNNLSNIEDLDVRSRTTVEKYRRNRGSLKKIAKELEVNYIVEGSGQKYGDEILLNIQLIEAKSDRHLFSEQFRKKIREVKDFIDLQGEIALKIVSKIEAEITPEEKQLMDRNPTFSLTAFDFFQRGREEHLKFKINNLNTTALLKAEKNYRIALKYDSCYSQTYAALADIQISKNRGSELFLETFLDSALYFADKAITYDKETAEAYAVKGFYYWYRGNREKALEEYDNALRYNPDLWQAYRGKGILFIDNEPVRSIKNFQKAANLANGSDLKIILGEMVIAYLWAGFTETAKKFNNEALRLFEDSVMYFINLGAIESQQGNTESAVKYYTKASFSDPDFTNFLWFYHDINRQLGFNYLFSENYAESLTYFKKWISILEKSGEISYNEMHRVAYAFWKNGNTEKAEYYFDLQMEHCNNLIKSNHPWSQNLFAFYDKAGIYAFRGNKEEAYKNLRIFNQITHVPLWMVSLIKTDPLFENLREDTEFQHIVKDVESKYQKEHKRIGEQLRQLGYN
jgi:TolB-like protein/AraC-like DNA-binding protein/Tfp pilus assembly protein PilF